MLLGGQKVGDRMTGWIKLHRCLLDKPIFQNEKLLKVWIWCLAKATHTEHEQLVGRQKVSLKPGQFVTGRNKAGTELNMKPSTAWDYLKLLETNSSINIKSDSKFSIVTVENWGMYQAKEENSDNKPNSKCNNKSTANQQQINTNKNVKNAENEKKDIYVTAQHLSITKIEYEKLIEQYGKKNVDEKIEYAQNYAKLNNYKSLYLTLNNWLKKDVGEKPKELKPLRLVFRDTI